MIDNQFKLITLIFFISLLSVHCKNSQLSLEDLPSNDLSWNNFASNGLSYNGRLVLPSTRQTFNSRPYAGLQPFNKELPSPHLFNEDALKYQPQQQNVFDLNYDAYAKLISKQPFNLLERPKNELSNDKVISNKKLNSFKSLQNGRSMLSDDEMMNRKTRSGQSYLQRFSLDHQPAYINLFNQDLLNAFSRNFYDKNENSQEKQSEELVEMYDSKPKKKNDNQKETAGNKENQIKEENISTVSKLLTNNSNYQPVVEQQSQNLSKSRISTLNNPSSLRKNKWNRVSKSTSFLGNNVSDCIKNCVSQGVLHPVQCHSLC